MAYLEEDEHQYGVRSETDESGRPALEKELRALFSQ
jgi:hypothetical protein